jgi:PIN domain nuclease of toxin-antitoxin system
MRLLIDTHLFLWAVAEPERLPEETRKWLESPENEVLFSAASIWELAVKLRTGRLQLSVPLEKIVETARRMGFSELPVTLDHALAVQALPLLHRDPFDHLLIAQAVQEPARFLTIDRLLGGYSDVVEVVS